MSALMLIIIGILIWQVATHRARRQERQLLERSSRVMRGVRGVLMCVHDDWAYWRLDGALMRAPLISGRAELRHAHAVDVLECEDLHPSDAIAVLNALDEAEVKYRPTGS